MTIMTEKAENTARRHVASAAGNQPLSRVHRLCRYGNRRSVYTPFGLTVWAFAAASAVQPVRFTCRLSRRWPIGSAASYA